MNTSMEKVNSFEKYCTFDYHISKLGISLLQVLIAHKERSRINLKNKKIQGLCLY